jgi:ammonia channel protein AmtB
VIVKIQLNTRQLVQIVACLFIAWVVNFFVVAVDTFGGHLTSRELLAAFVVNGVMVFRILFEVTGHWIFGAKG